MIEDLHWLKHFNHEYINDLPLLIQYIQLRLRNYFLNFRYNRAVSHIVNCQQSRPTN